MDNNTSEFASELMSTIRRAFPAKMPKRSAREKVLSSFHSLSLNEIEKVWGNLYLSVGKELTMDRMMRQYTSEKVFAEIYLSHFVATDSQASMSSATASPGLIKIHCW